MPESRESEHGRPPLASSLLLSQEGRAMSSSGKSEPSWNPHGLSAQNSNSTARDPWDKCLHGEDGRVAGRASWSPDGQPSGRWGNRQALTANGHPGLGQPAPRSEALLPVGVGGEHTLALASPRILLQGGVHTAGPDLAGAKISPQPCVEVLAFATHTPRASKSPSDPSPRRLTVP